MATSHPRIQVTLDPEFARALARIEPQPKSQARLVRDLALRGAQEIERERRAATSASDVLLAIAAGEIDHDFDAVAAVVAAREDRLP